MFIVFEGIDGCGKTTQIWKLAEYLSSFSKYAHVVVTRNPYKDRNIRKILRLDEEPETRAEKLTELFIKDRREQIDEVIKPALEKNLVVISDRYKYSTICYQAAQGQNIQHLIDIQEDMPIPDFIFIVDMPVEIAFERMKKDGVREKEHKFEKSREFQEKARQNYLKLPELFPDEKIIILDGNKSIEEIFEEIKKYFTNIKL